MPTHPIDNDAAFNALKEDKPLAELIAQMGKIHMEPHPDPYEMLTRSIVFQQISGKAGTAIWNRFRALFPGDEMPPPSVVVRKRQATLRKVGLSNSKANYVLDLARKCVSGEVEIAKLYKSENEEIAEQLLGVKGIGPWSVDMFLMFGLARPDVLPTGDLGIAKGFQHVFKLDELPKPAQMQELAEPWRPYRSYASMYLWRSLDLRAASKS